MATPIISGSEFATKVCEALGIDPGLTVRVVLDSGSPNNFGPVKVYVEMYGDDRLLNINWVDLNGAVIEWSDKAK